MIACFVRAEGALVALPNRENFPGNAFIFPLAKLSHVFVFCGGGALVASSNREAPDSSMGRSLLIVLVP